MLCPFRGRFIDRQRLNPKTILDLLWSITNTQNICIGSILPDMKKRGFKRTIVSNIARAEMTVEDNA